MSVTITTVEQGSPACRAGIKAGETLHLINQNEINDVLDYRFYITERSLELLLSDEQGAQRSVSIHKSRYDDIGLGFETYLMDKQRSCKNKCIFCFVDQNPKGMRESIYFKDDDDRLSFLFGNYITLTNLKPHDIERIIKMRISPINISVHTTNPELRQRMMANPNSGSSLALLKRFCEGGITINTQLVLCPEHNDGEELERTLRDLGELYPNLGSIACVPVGLTGHREGLYPLRSFTKEEAGRTIDIIEAFSDRMLKDHGERVAYPADEFFLKAERQIPPPEYYGDFNQLENGVGLLSLCIDEFHAACEEITPLGIQREISVATGVAAYPIIKTLCDRAMELDPELKVNVFDVPSVFFGGAITVTGLVTASDIDKRVQGLHLGDLMVIPSVMLRHEQDLFLDNNSIQELEVMIGCGVKVISATGTALAQTLLLGKEQH